MITSIQLYLLKKTAAQLKLTLQELIVYQGPSVRGLDSLAFALVRATTDGHHQSRDEQEVVNIDHIRLRLVLTFYI